MKGLDVKVSLVASVCTGAVSAVRRVRDLSWHDMKMIIMFYWSCCCCYYSVLNYYDYDYDYDYDYNYNYDYNYDYDYDYYHYH